MFKVTTVNDNGFSAFADSHMSIKVGKDAVYIPKGTVMFITGKVSSSSISLEEVMCSYTEKTYASI